MQLYGEKGLNAYARAHARGDKQMMDKLSEVKMFWERSTMPGYCYLTTYGILQRLNFLGFIEATSRAIGRESEDYTSWEQHQISLSVALAKKTNVANIFGSANQTSPSARLWICLTRKYCGDGKYGTFQLRPVASSTLDFPLHASTHYLDESGGMCRGHVWYVGYVLRGNNRSPQQSALDGANGTAIDSNMDRAYEMHGMLPTIEVALAMNN